MPLPDTIHVIVTADDIANGTPESWSDDAMARAVQRAVGSRYRVESAQFVLTIFEGTERHRFKLPREANEFIDAFDDSQLRSRLSPFSFTLTRFEADCYRVVDGVAEPGRAPQGLSANRSRSTRHGH